MRKTQILVGMVILGCGLLGFGIKAKKQVQRIPLSPVGSVLGVDIFQAEPRKQEKIVYGFLPYWEVSEFNQGQLGDLTDISYFGITLNDDSTIETGDTYFNTWQTNTTLKKIFNEAKIKGVRTGITVINHSDEQIKKFLTCKECQKKAIYNIIKLVKEANLDDLGINFEMAGNATQEEQRQFSEFVHYMNTNLKKALPNATLTVTMSPQVIYGKRLVEPTKIARTCDRLFLMAYDFHVKNPAGASAIAPMGENKRTSNFTIRKILWELLKTIPPQKIILGIPYYGYVKDEASKSGKTLTYAGLKEKYGALLMQSQWDSQAQTPFIKIENTTVYFENEKSLLEKYKLQEELHLAGVGIWALGYDGQNTELWKLMRNYAEK